MRKSQRLRLRDVRNIYRLIGECRDLGTDVQAWYGRLLDGAGQIIGAPLVTGGHIQGWSTGRPRALMVLDNGWTDPRMHEVFQQWIAEGRLDADELYYRMCLMRRPLLTYYRRQVIPDGEWYASTFFNEYRRLGQTDDCIYSVAHRPDGDLFQSICLHRAPSDPPFGEWARRMLHLLHDEITPLLRRQLATAQDPPFCLPPRLRETLACLLEGDGEKQVAVRLGLSRQTVHDYVKALYRHYGVSSRAELLSVCLRRSSAGR